jgi:hypothetical protein
MLNSKEPKKEKGGNPYVEKQIDECGSVDRYRFCDLIGHCSEFACMDGNRKERFRGDLPRGLILYLARGE